jgi:hypothetical protein
MYGGNSLKLTNIGFASVAGSSFGWVEFQLLHSASEVAASELLFVMPEKRSAESPPPAQCQSDADPLWDRWLDG